MLRGYAPVGRFYVKWVRNAEHGQDVLPCEPFITLFNGNAFRQGIGSRFVSATLVSRRSGLVGAGCSFAVRGSCGACRMRLSRRGKSGYGRLRLVERRSDVTGVNRKQVRMLFGPFRGEAVQRAFGVVFLVGDHAADSNDQIIEPFRGSPEIADANRGVVEIRMEYRRQHAALRRAAGIAQREIYFQMMDWTFLDFAISCYVQTFDVINETVGFGRHSCRSGNLNERPADESLNKLIVIEFQAADARREHDVRLPNDVRELFA